MAYASVIAAYRPDRAQIEREGCDRHRYQDGEGDSDEEPKDDASADSADRKVGDLITEKVALLGENIKVARFVRLAVGETAAADGDEAA